MGRQRAEASEVMFVKDNELVGILVEHKKGVESVITWNDITFARFTPLNGSPLTSLEARISDLAFCDMSRQLSRLSPEERNFVDRYICELCGGIISGGCSSSLDKCGNDLLALRLGSVRMLYRSRGR